jgi:hypothetical protein
MKSNHFTFDTYLPLALDDTPITVSFDYEPEERGSRGKYGEPLEPDYPPAIDITEVIDKETGKEIYIGEHLVNIALEELCWDHLSSLK